MLKGQELKIAKRNKALAYKLSDRDHEIIRMFSMNYRPSKIQEELRAQGIDLSIPSIYRIREKALEKVQAETDELAEKIKYQELDRLEMAREKIAGAVANGDLHAIDRWLRISESVRKLRGLDPANKSESKVEVGIGPTTENDYAIALEGLAARARKWQPEKSTDEILKELMTKSAAQEATNESGG